MGEDIRLLNQEASPGKGERNEQSFESYQREAAALLQVAGKLKLHTPDTTLARIKQVQGLDPNSPSDLLDLTTMVKGLRSSVTQYETFNTEKVKHAFEVRDRIQKLFAVILPKLDEQITIQPKVDLEPITDYTFTFDKEDRKQLGLIDPIVDLAEDDYKAGYTNILTRHPELPKSFEVFRDDFGLALNAWKSHVAEPEWEDRIEAFEQVNYRVINIFKAEFLNIIATPTGAYGEKLSHRLDQATAKIGYYLEQLHDDFADYQQTVGEAEVNTLVRSQDSKGDPPMELSTFEGVQSIQQAISLLAAQEIPGYNFVDENTLVVDLLKSGIVDQLARILPTGGYVGPMALVGVYFKDLVSFEVEKGFQLNRQLVKEFHETRLSQRAYQAGRQSDKFQTLHGCPAAMRSEDGTTSVSEIGQLFARVFEATS